MLFPLQTHPTSLEFEHVWLWSRGYDPNLRGLFGCFHGYIMLHNVTYNITYVEYIRYPSIASIPKLVHHALRRCVETALPVAKSLELPIKVEPGICEILTVGAMACLDLFRDGGRSSMIWQWLWWKYGEHMGNMRFMSHHCLVVSNFFLCLFFEKAIEMGDSPKTQDPIDLSNSMWESYPCHKPTSFGDGFYMHKMVMNLGMVALGIGFPTLCCQVFPPGFLDAEELQKDFGLGNSETWPLLVSVSSFIHHSS